MSQTVSTAAIETVDSTAGSSDQRHCETFQMSGVFWTQFVKQYWYSRPTLIKSPFKRPLLSAQEAFDILSHASDDYRSFQQRFIKVFVGSGRQMCDLDDILPRKEDGSITEYSRRLADLVQAKDACLVFEKLQTYNADLWMRARHFLSGLYEHVGIPGDAADLDFFFGKYSRTPTGIHKDELSNFSYVISGAKTMLFWPHDAFKDLVPREAMGLGTVRYEQFLDTAIAIEAEPGDLIFWPSSYWHIGVSEGSWHLTLNISCYINKSFMQSLRQLLATREFSAWLNSRRESMVSFPCDVTPGSEPTLPHKIRQEAELVRELGNHPRLAETIEDLWFRKLSASGFESVPPPLPIPTLHDDVFVSGEPHFHILLVPRSPGRCKVFANGNILQVPFDDATSELVSRLNSGSEFRVGDLIGECVRHLPEHVRHRRVQHLKRMIELLCSFRSLAWRENRRLNCE